MQPIMVKFKSATASPDDLINGGCEAIARSGYQVGNFLWCEHEEGKVTGMMDVDDRLVQLVEETERFEAKYLDIKVVIELR